MTTLLGPTCGVAALDDMARALALDLFVDPAGIRALAAYWVALFVDRPVRPMPAPSMCALITQLRAIKEGGPAAFTLELDGYERDDRDLSFVLRLFRDDLQLTLSYEFLRHRGARHRALRALDSMLETLVPPQSAEAAQPAAFATRTLSGLGGELRVAGFCQNAMLAFYFNARLFVVTAVAEYVRALRAQPLIMANRTLVAELCLPVAHALLAWAAATPDGGTDAALEAVAARVADAGDVTPLEVEMLAPARALYAAVRETWAVAAAAAAPPLTERD
jgi:hypothetical protein